MTAVVLRAFTYEHNVAQAADQDYELAKVHYRCALHDADFRCQHCRDRLDAALVRKNAAYDKFMFYKFNAQILRKENL